ncbi:DUF4214 domain-containing protein [Methylobacterium oxalidis]|uniref:DUF4214 domain-containing protein n=1 Tax=Methylobacterium oxalidis TaxID=944322 RepID=UPI003316278E
MPAASGGEPVETRASASWGLAKYGYLRDAFVFADANGNGVRDANEVAATTDANGHYDFPAPGAGTLVVTGGLDAATGIAATGSLTAPAGSLVVSSLTTLLDRIARAHGGDVEAAESVLATAVGFAAGTNLMRLDAVTGVQLGQASAAAVFAAEAMLRDTVALIERAGGTGDVYGLLAADSATLASVLDRAADGWTARYDALLTLAQGAGLGDLQAASVAAIAAASNERVAETIYDPANSNAYLSAISAIGRTVQGDAAEALRAAGPDVDKLRDAVTAYTGHPLSAAVDASLTKVGPFHAPAATAILGDGFEATPFDGGLAPNPIGPAGPSAHSDASLFGTTAHSLKEAGGLVHALYEAVLGRAPDPLGLEYWASALKAGFAPASLAKALLASAEYEAQGTPASVDGFLDGLYQSALHRGVDAGGKQYFADALSQGLSRADVAVSVATSAEAQGILGPALQAGIYVPDEARADVARLYHALLGRAPDAQGLAALSEESKAGAGLASVATIMLASSEYTTQVGDLDAATFVDHLYLGALGRHAEVADATFWTGALQHGLSRADAAVAIGDSVEAQHFHLAHIEAGWHLSA